MMPRKQRHTAKRVFDRLVAEYGFDGSYSGVRRYVKAWREANREVSDGYLRLECDPGVMQVDFGVALADVAGREHTVHVLVASLPYSNMGYAVAVPGENAECLCQGPVDGVRAHGRGSRGAGDGQCHRRRDDATATVM